MAFYTYGQLAAVHLTGKTRVRVGWFGRLILQVEVKHPKEVSTDQLTRCHGTTQRHEWAAGAFTFWQDARASDLASISPPVVACAVPAGVPA